LGEIIRISTLCGTTRIDQGGMGLLISLSSIMFLLEAILQIFVLFIKQGDKDERFWGSEEVGEGDIGDGNSLSQLVEVLIFRKAHILRGFHRRV